MVGSNGCYGDNYGMIHKFNYKMLLKMFYSNNSNIFQNKSVWSNVLIFWILKRYKLSCFKNTFLYSAEFKIEV